MINLWLEKLLGFPVLTYSSIFLKFNLIINKEPKNTLERY